MAEKWIQDAINPANKGKLHRALRVKTGETIPKNKLIAAAKKKGITGARARLAVTLASFNKPKRGSRKKK